MRKSRRPRNRPVTPCLLATMQPPTLEATPPSAAPTAAPPAEFRISRTSPRRRDVAQLVHELGITPLLLSPLPVTPEKVSSPPWIDLDTSPIPTTPERANTPSPTCRARVPRFTQDMPPAPPLTAIAELRPRRMVELFGRHRLYLPGGAGRPSRWITIPPRRDKNTDDTVLVLASMARNIGPVV
ncbi:hypothetical protein CBL_05088 [Carabus blaptoides fortunei]